MLIVTNDGIIDLKWSLFKTDMNNVKYENIEWVEVDQNSIWDKILNKWTVIIHKIWEEFFELNDALAPYVAVAKIDEMMKKNANNKPQDRFETVIEALWWVVEDYMERKAMFAWRKIKTKKQVVEDNSYMEIISSEDGTIDLR